MQSLQGSIEDPDAPLIDNDKALTEKNAAQEEIELANQDNADQFTNFDHEREEINDREEPSQDHTNQSNPAPESFDADAIDKDMGEEEQLDEKLDQANNIFNATNNDDFEGSIHPLTLKEG